MHTKENSEFRNSMSATRMRPDFRNAIVKEVDALVPTVKIVQTALLRLGSLTPVVGVSIKIGKKSIFLGEISKSIFPKLNGMIISELMSFAEDKLSITSMQYSRPEAISALKTDFKVVIDFDHGTTVEDWAAALERARGSYAKHDKKKYDKGISRLKELFRFYNFSEADVIETWKISEVEKVIKE